MKKNKAKPLFLIAFSFLLIAMIISGYSYYRVTDPTTDKVYYTTDVKELSGGAVKLKDAKTQRTVTVINSEIEKISEDEYKHGLYSEKTIEAPKTESKKSESEKNESE